MFLSKLAIATIVTRLKSMLLEFFRCFQAVGSFPKLNNDNNKQETESFVRVTNVVVSANKIAQVGTSFGKADLPYEQDDRILVPRSSKGSLPLQSHSGSSHRTFDVRNVEIDAKSKDMRVIKGSSVTIANGKRRIKPY